MSTDSTQSKNIKSSWQPVLETLLINLQHLRSYHLPGEIQSELEKVIEKASTLPELLAAETEQLRLAALYQVSHTLGTSLNLDEVLTQVMDAVINLTGAERGFLMLVDPDYNDSQRGASLRLRAARNFEHETLERKEAISRTVIDSVMSSGTAVLTTNAQSDPRFANQESVMLHALRAIMCVPLRTRGELFGVVYVDNRIQSGLFTTEDLNLLDAFAAQAAIAIENARLYARTDQALNQRLSELETLTQIDRELNSRLDFEHIMDITCQWAMRGTGSDEAWVGLVGEENDRLNIVAGELDSFPAAESLPNFGGEPFAQLFHEDSNGVSLAAPIFHSGRLAGVLIVQKAMIVGGENQRFSEDEKQFLARLTARAANAIENARLYEAVQQANQAKTKFVSVVSHELRIPMTSIRGYTDLLRQQTVGPVNDQQRTFLETIRSNVDRMATLVSDLSDISRIESGRLKLEPALVSIPALIDETIRSLQPRIDEKKLSLELDIPADLPQAYADPTRVGQVLTNLVSNAWKYTPEHGKIHLHSHTEGNHLYISVTDTGIGISEADQQHLFDQFFRSEDSAVREQQGWGLGLNVTKRLVELMNGKIGHQSKLGGGSTFWFTLPTTADMT